MSDVMRKKVIVKTAEDFANTAKQTCPGITIVYVSKAEVEDGMNLLNQVSFTEVKSLPGIRKIHHVEVTGASSVRVSNYKGSAISREHRFK